jgi:hypothetical protein
MQDYELQLAKENAIAAADFATAAKLRDAQHELRRQVDALLAPLLKSREGG